MKVRVMRVADFRFARSRFSERKKTRRPRKISRLVFELSPLFSSVKKVYRTERRLRKR
jgi:hypothetical protein